MFYSDDYLRRMLPEGQPRAEFVPPEVEVEVSRRLGLDGKEDGQLVARSVRWTYAISNELRLNQFEVDGRFSQWWPVFGLMTWSPEPLTIGLLDPSSERDGFALIAHVPQGAFAGARQIAEIAFPRLGMTTPLWAREASYEDHGPTNPVGGTSAAWAECRATQKWGVLTAGHVVRGTQPGGSVRFMNGGHGSLLRTRFPGVDCAFVGASKPSPAPSILATLRFPAAGQSVTVETNSGPVQRTVVGVETNMQTIAVISYDIKVFLDECLLTGDSGALVRTQANEAVAVYLGSLSTPTVPTGFAGRALNFQQAMFALDVDVYR